MNLNFNPPSATECGRLLLGLADIEDAVDQGVMAVNRIADELHEHHGRPALNQYDEKLGTSDCRGFGGMLDAVPREELEEFIGGALRAEARLAAGGSNSGEFEAGAGAHGGGSFGYEATVHGGISSGFDATVHGGGASGYDAIVYGGGASGRDETMT